MNVRVVNTRVMRDDRGSASVLGVFLVLALSVVAVAALALVQLALAHQRAMSAADLAATSAYIEGCATAADIAQANGAHLLHCDLAGEDVVVTTVVDTPTIITRLLGPLAPQGVAATSRAGTRQ